MLRNLLSPIFRLPRRTELPFIPVRAVAAEPVAAEPIAAEPVAIAPAPRATETRRSVPVAAALRFANRWSNQLSS